MLQAASALLDLLNSAPSPLAPPNPPAAAIYTTPSVLDDDLSMDIDSIFLDTLNTSGTTVDTSVDLADAAMDIDDSPAFGGVSPASSTRTLVDLGMNCSEAFVQTENDTSEASVQAPEYTKVLCDTAVQTETESIQVVIPRTYRKLDKAKSMHDALATLRSASLTPMDLILNICDPEQPSFEAVRNKFFGSDNHGRLLDFVRLIHDNKHTKDAFSGWLSPVALKHVGDLVDEEMESAKPDLRMYTTEINPQYMAEWDLAKFMDPVVKKAPTFTRILERATYSKETCDDDDSTRNRPIVVSFILYYFATHR